jgi:hypothetical protein
LDNKCEGKPTTQRLFDGVVVVPSSTALESPPESSTAPQTLRSAPHRRGSAISSCDQYLILSTKPHTKRELGLLDRHLHGTPLQPMERLPVTVPEPQSHHPPNALAHGVSPLPEQACDRDAVEPNRCAFEKVPREILDQIVSYLACADVARLVRTSRAFFNSTDTETALYRHLEFNQAYNDDRPISRPGLTHLALNLFNRRARVLSIRSFKLTGEDGSPLLQFTFDPPEIYPLMPSNVECRDPVCDDRARADFLNSKDNKDDVGVGLFLLSLMPNMVGLCINTRILQNRLFLELFLAVFCPPPRHERTKADYRRHLPLPHLRSLEVEVGSPDM